METEQFKKLLSEPALKDLYLELADDDVKLAEMGVTEYQALLAKADQP